MGCTPRKFGLFIAAFICPPAAVLIANDSFGVEFWINVLLTLLAWLPGWIHALFVVSRVTETEEYYQYTQPTGPPALGYVVVPNTYPPVQSPYYVPPQVPPPSAPPPPHGSKAYGGDPSQV